MSSSTTEHPIAHHPNAVRHLGLADLVRTIGGVGAPAARPWQLVSGQPLGFAAGGLRRRVLQARVVCGTLIVTDDLLGSELDFTVLVTDTNHRVDLATRVTGLVSVDSWHATGTTTTASGSRPVSLDLGYNGVFRHGGRLANLWLSIQATLDLPELGVTVGRRHAGRLKIDGDLNLNPIGAGLRSTACV